MSKQGIGKPLQAVVATALLLALVAPAAMIQQGPPIARAQGNDFAIVYTLDGELSDIAVDTVADEAGEATHVYGVLDGENSITVYSIYYGGANAISTIHTGLPAGNTFISADNGVVYVTHYNDVDTAGQGLITIYASADAGLTFTIVDSREFDTTVDGHPRDAIYYGGTLYIIMDRAIYIYDGTTITRLVSEINVLAAGKGFNDGSLVIVASDNSYTNIYKLDAAGTTLLYSNVFAPGVIGVGCNESVVGIIGDVYYGWSPFVANNDTMEFKENPGDTYLFYQGIADGVVYYEPPYVIGVKGDSSTGTYTIKLLSRGAHIVDEPILANQEYYPEPVASDRDGDDVVLAFKTQTGAVHVIATSHSNIVPLGGGGGARHEFSHFELSSFYSMFDPVRWYEPVDVVGPIENHTSGEARYYLVSRVLDYDNGKTSNPGVAVFELNMSQAGASVKQLFRVQGPTTMDPYDAILYSAADTPENIFIIASGVNSDGYAAIMYYNLTSRGPSPSFRAVSLQGALQLLFTIDYSDQQTTETRIYGIMEGGGIYRILFNTATGEVFMASASASIPGLLPGYHRAVEVFSEENYTIIAAAVDESGYETIKLYNLTSNPDGSITAAMIAQLDRTYSTTIELMDGFTVMDANKGIPTLFGELGIASPNGTIWGYNMTTGVFTVYNTTPAYRYYDIEVLTVFETPTTFILGSKQLGDGTSEIAVLRVEGSALVESGTYAYTDAGGVKPYNFGFRMLWNPYNDTGVFIGFSHGSPQGVVYMSASAIAAQPLPVPEPPVYTWVLAVALATILAVLLYTRSRGIK